MERFLGIDAHSKSMTISVVSAAGKRIREDVIETNGQALVGYLAQLPGRKHVCLEETELSNWLFEVIKPRVEEVVVENPQWKAGVKNDSVDAWGLAERLRTGQVEIAVYKSPERYTKLRELARTYQALTGDVVRVKNRLRSHYRRRALPYPGHSISAQAEGLDSLPAWMHQPVETLGAELALIEELPRRNPAGHDRGIASLPDLADSRDRTRYRTHPRGTAAADRRHATSLSDQATVLRVLRVRGRNEDFIRLGSSRQALGASARTANSRAQSKLQPDAQGDFQGTCGHRDSRSDGTTSESLRPARRQRNATELGSCDSGTQDRRGRTHHVEEEREVRPKQLERRNSERSSGKRFRGSCAIGDPTERSCWFQGSRGSIQSAASPQRASCNQERSGTRSLPRLDVDAFRRATDKTMPPHRTERRDGLKGPDGSVVQIYQEEPVPLQYRRRPSASDPETQDALDTTLEQHCKGTFDAKRFDRTVEVCT